MKAEISLIGDAIQYADWGMSWDEVREMAKSGLLSFQAHTKSLHSDHTAQGGRLGVLKIASESWSHYVRTLGNDTKAILDLIEKEVPRYSPIREESLTLCPRPSPAGLAARFR